MKRSYCALLCLLLIVMVSGCGKKEQNEHASKPLTTVEDTNQSTPAQDHPVIHPATKSKTTPAVANAEHYLLADTTQEQNLTIAIDNEQHLYVQGKREPVVVLNFFSPWSYPSQHQLFSLVDLQKKYAKELRVIGIVLNPQNYTEQTQQIRRKTGGDLLFVATGKENNAFAKQLLSPLKLPDFLPIPLTVIYHNGLYYRHYEGAVPIEMLEHDITTIMK